jgi:hypothetical protein
MTSAFNASAFDDITDDNFQSKIAVTKSRVISAFCILSYQSAKQRLQERGLSDKEIESLSTYQIVVPYLISRIRQIYDLMCVVVTFERNESHTALPFDEFGITDLNLSTGDFWLNWMVPWSYSAHNAYLRMSQTVDRLKIVEAVRYYAAVHDGKLPESLDAIKEVPVPKNCAVTGKPYKYRLEGKKITIDFNSFKDHSDDNKEPQKTNSRMEIILE